MSAPLLQVRDLHKSFPVRRGMLLRVTGHVHAVRGVDLEVPAGETLGLVGESGCGKTTVGRCVLRLMEPDRGTVHFDGRSVLDMSAAELRALRTEMQVVFQDPYASLNPRMTVGQALGEPLVAHGLARGAAVGERVAGVLQRVGLDPALADRYPHDFSGGQRQRIAIARALVLRPRFVVCDEAVSALDVSVQAQILNLLADLQDDLGIGYLFISHDLAVVRHVSHRVAVMVHGRIVEHAQADALFAHPRHPYTRALMASVPGAVEAPGLEPPGLEPPVAGDGPEAAQPEAGCPYQQRCSQVIPRCRQGTAPPEVMVAEGHSVRCWLEEGSS
jgi:peptide/nickel transport system ATP-binding protein